MAPALIATLLHLETGHVLAAVTAVGLKPDLDALTGGHVRVRVPGTDEYVDVPSEHLTATRAPVTGAVLDRAQSYVLATNGTLSFEGEPKVGAAVTGTTGAQVVMAWQVGSDALVTKGALGTGNTLPGGDPAGAKARVVAIAGEPLYLSKLP
jgi:hypothetical protein